MFSPLNPNRVFVLHWTNKTGNGFTKSPTALTFAITDDNFFNLREVFANAVAFLVTLPDNAPSGKSLLWVGVVKPNSQTLLLYASQDDGDTFSLVVLPTGSKAPQGYVILDDSFGTTFLHASFGDGSGVGNLFASDLVDQAFSLVLENQTASVAVGPAWLEAFTPLGTYLSASQAASGEVNALSTFDNGYTWRLLPGVSPSCVADPACSLHLYFRNHIRIGFVHSQKKAPGLLFGTGNEGQGLDPQSPSQNFYGSIDGGRTWELSISGPHAFTISDSGNVLVAVDLSTVSTNSVLISTDWGSSWARCQVDTNSFRVFNLPESPAHDSSLSYVAASYNLTASVFYTLDSSDMYPRVCGSDDYETWAPDGGNCTAGRQVTILRRRRTAVCRYPLNFNAVVSSTKCICVATDITCAYCFIVNPKIAPLNGSIPVCVPDPACGASPWTAPTTCVGVWSRPSGYRIKIGNACVGGASIYVEPIVSECPLSPGELVAVILCSILGITVIIVLIIAVYFKVRNRLVPSLDSLELKSVGDGGGGVVVTSPTTTSEVVSTNAVAEDFM